MAWEWSHAREAYEAARANLGRKPRRWLEVCLAEIRADACQEVATQIGDEEYVWDVEYNKVLKELRSRKNPMASEWIADAIWEFAEDYRTCDNGGYNAYCCKSGCHQVSFTDKEADRLLRRKA